MIRRLSFFSQSSKFLTISISRVPPLRLSLDEITFLSSFPSGAEPTIAGKVRFPLTMYRCCQIESISYLRMDLSLWRIWKEVLSTFSGGKFMSTSKSVDFMSLLLGSYYLLKGPFTLLLRGLVWFFSFCPSRMLYPRICSP